MPAGSAPVRAGLLGAGFIAAFHARALATVPGVRLVAACDSDPARARSFAQAWALEGSYASLAEMARAARLGVIHVLVPPPCHAQAVLECLQAGCDVFLEKPAAVASAEARRLERAAAEAGRAVGVNHNATFHPAFRRLVREIRHWRLGAVQHVTTVTNVPLRQLDKGQHSHWMFQSPENILLEQAPHPLSQIHFLLGPVTAVSALPSGPVRLNTGRTFYEGWQISMLCERGSAQAFLSFGREYHDAWLHVIGQDGAALVDLRRNTIAFGGKTRFMDPVDQLANSAGAGLSLARQGLRNFIGYVLGFLKIRPPADPFFEGLRDSIAAFYEARAKGQPPPAGLAEGAAVLEACERIAASARRFTEEQHAG